MPLNWGVLRGRHEKGLREKGRILEPAIGEFFQADRFLLFAGLFLCCLGALHIPFPYLFPRSGSYWASNTSWRKSILFGLSTGVTLLSIAWVLSCLRLDEKVKRRLSYLIGLCACLEVALICFQIFRGHAAHFNVAAGSDRFISLLIETSLLTLFVALGYLTFRSVCVPGGEGYPEKCSQLVRTIVRQGMFFLFLGCVLGFLHSVYGYLGLFWDYDPHIVPPRGVPRFAHGIPLHAIQIFYIISLIGRTLQVRDELLVKLILSGRCFLLGLTCFAILQVLSGRARFEMSLLGAFVLFCTALASVKILLRKPRGGADG